MQSIKEHYLKANRSGLFLIQPGVNDMFRSNLVS
jgi:hypothetical protein